jgi:hypothetical protein
MAIICFNSKSKKENNLIKKIILIKNKRKIPVCLYSYGILDTFIRAGNKQIHNACITMSIVLKK